jgi:hypothetical protein
MKLMTKKIEKRFEQVGSQENEIDPLVILKLFDPCGRYTYYATEFNKEDNVLFGFCVSPLGSDCDEWGSTSLDEIKSVKNRMGLGIERDLYFKEQRIKSVLK